jgi:hypothetical protein
MTVRLKVTMQGIEAVRTVMEAIGGDAVDGEVAALEVTGALAFLDMQSATPIGATGRLRGGEYLTHAKRVGEEVVMVIGTSGTGYTRIQHYAKRFRHHRGHRLFMTGPAWRARNKCVTLVEREVMKRIAAHPHA